MCLQGRRGGAGLEIKGSKFLYLSPKTYVIGTTKNHLNKHPKHIKGLELELFDSEKFIATLSQIFLSKNLNSPLCSIHVH